MQEVNLNQTPDLEYFVYFDSKTGSYDHPMPAVNSEDLIRAIKNLMQSPQQRENKLVTNSEDFSVFKIAQYWKKTATFNSFQPQHVCNLHDIRALVMKTIPQRNDAPIQLMEQPSGH